MRLGTSVVFIRSRQPSPRSVTHQHIETLSTYIPLVPGVAGIMEVGKTDRVQLGLVILHDPTEPTIDVIAVHGLGANPDWTWVRK